MYQVGLMISQKTSTDWMKKQMRSFKCSGYGGCEMSFTRAEHLERHVRKHTGEKPFRCEVCYRFFSRIDNLKQHRESVHAMGTRRVRKRKGRTVREGPSTAAVSLMFFSSPGDLKLGCISSGSLASVNSFENTSPSLISLYPSQMPTSFLDFPRTVAFMPVCQRLLLPPISVVPSGIDSCAFFKSTSVPIVTHIHSSPKKLQHGFFMTSVSDPIPPTTGISNSTSSLTPHAVTATKFHHNNGNSGRISINSMLS